MLHFTWITLIVLSTRVFSTGAFFVYNDCDMECRQRNVSCLILELDPTYFPCECLEESRHCVSLATDFQVCLRPGAEALGGRLIWSDFDRYRNGTLTTTRSSTTHEPTTPTTANVTTPHPGPTSRTDRLLALTIVLSAVTILSLATNLIQLFLQLRRNDRNYTRLSLPNDVYRDTTENAEPEEELARD